MLGMKNEPGDLNIYRKRHASNIDVRDRKDTQFKKTEAECPV